jgi:hypothetical protein
LQLVRHRVDVRDGGLRELHVVLAVDVHEEVVALRVQVLRGDGVVAGG